MTPAQLEDIAEYLGLVVGFLNSLGVLVPLQIALGAALIIVTGTWLFGFLGGRR